MLVPTMVACVNGFALDSEVGEFILTHRDMNVAEDTKHWA